MKRRAILFGILAASPLLAGGCASAPERSDGAVALGARGPVRVEPAAPRRFFLGAGDALGEQVFTYYVASLRASGEVRYATGAEDRP